mmetsp:Transcript_7580/g.10946  ORF Transcript_7580/g.10946 Transcript_7580/m.10946 type:complete len:457 (-) Transcript_7580:27-1397(-)
MTFARRLGRTSLPSTYADDDIAAVTMTNSNKKDDHKHQNHSSKFLIFGRATSCTSALILMIGATLMLMTISLIPKNFHPLFDLPHQSQNLKLTYTAELAAKAVEPTVWTCGETDRHKQTAVVDPITNQRPFFAFVHVYKTGGSTVREFFREYAAVCKKSLALVAECGSGDRRKGLEDCKFLSCVNAPQSIERVNSTILHDNYDILGGHFSFGMADDIFSNDAANPNNDNGAPQVRHMTFLRQPITRFVSHILYQQKQGNADKTETVEETVEDIKKRIRSSKEKGEYVSSSIYPIYNNLLTPEQHAMKYDQEQTTHEQEELVKVQLSIDNLLRYNAIVGMTETFSQSIQIFEHAMGQIVNSTRKKEEVQEMFSRYIGEKESKNGSKRNDISTGSVLKELNKDGEFMAIFREFVKYEQMIVDFAMDMHQKQYEAVKKGHFERYTLDSSDMLYLDSVGM